MTIKNCGMSVKKKRINCNLWPVGAKNIYKNWVIGPEPVILPSKPCNRKNRIKNMERILCCCAYFLSMKISPATPVSNKMIKSSSNSWNLVVYRETKCLLFEISTEFVVAKIKTKIKKRDGFYKRLDAKFKFFLVVFFAKKNRWQTEPLLMTLI